MMKNASLNRLINNKDIFDNLLKRMKDIECLDYEDIEKSPFKIGFLLGYLEATEEPKLAEYIIP